MAKIQSGVSLVLYSVVIVLCINLNNGDIEANQNSWNFIDFSEIKSDIFYYETNTEYTHQYTEEDAFQCLLELNAIKEAVNKTELWALKMLDAWGKIPSSVFEGNLYEFGGFSECFHIEQNNERYETQYCLSHLIVDGILPKPRKFDVGTVNMENILHQEDGVSHDTRAILPQSEKGPAITFGMCLPASCPTDVLTTLINEQISQKVKNVSINIIKNSCQFQEDITEWRTLDKVTIGLIGAVLFLVLVSTMYDITCTITNRSKSQALLAFSAYTNGVKLLSYKKPKSSEVMSCVNGIRVLTTQWVVLGHTFAIFVTLPTRNIATAFATFPTKYENMAILSAFISVDTFFVLSGLFVTISMLKHLEKTNGKMNVPLLYIHRYLRLTPILGITMLFSITLLRYLGNGPIWSLLMDFFMGQCERNWWSCLLYIQNYYNPNDMCLMHSWYLSVDFQLFLMAPPVVYLIYRYKMKTLLLWILLILGSMGCLLGTRVKNDIGFLMAQQDINVMSKVYFPTHLRFTPWLIGIIAGYVFYKVRNTTVRIPKLFNIFAWILTLGTFATVIFSNYPLVQADSKATPIVYGLYDTFSRITWAIALCYLIFACVNGYGGPINSFLSHPLWQPLSRLSYSIYLIHFPVIMITTATMKSSLYFSEWNAYHAFLGNYVISVFVAVVATLMFESPIVVIEKIIFGPRKKSHPTEKVEQNGDQEIKTEEKPTEPNGTHS